MSLANIFKIICGKFHQNRPIRMGCRDDTHTHTQTHTQTHRHPRFDPNIFSQNLTEYKNMLSKLFSSSFSCCTHHTHFIFPSINTQLHTLHPILFPLKTLLLTLHHPFWTRLKLLHVKEESKHVANITCINLFSQEIHY